VKGKKRYIIVCLLLLCVAVSAALPEWVCHCKVKVGREVRELLSQYEFPGDDIPVIAGSALKALEGDEAMKAKRP